MAPEKVVSALFDGSNDYDWVVLKFNLPPTEYLKVLQCLVVHSYYLFVHSYYLLKLSPFAENSDYCELKGLLHQLLSLKWMVPKLVAVLGHYLDKLGPFLNIIQMMLAV